MLCVIRNKVFIYYSIVAVYQSYLVNLTSEFKLKTTQGKVPSIGDRF